MSEAGGGRFYIEVDGGVVSPRFITEDEARSWAQEHHLVTCTLIAEGPNKVGTFDRIDLRYCEVCGTPATDHAFPSRNILTRLRGEAVPLPRHELCSEHFDELKTGILELGWCDEDGCRRWGRAGDLSPCGQPYRRI